MSLFPQEPPYKGARTIKGAHSPLGHLYRYEYEHNEDYWGGRLVIWQFPITKKTPCGVKVDAWGRERFILDNSRKRFACVTKGEALLSFQARKRRQLKILEAQMEDVKNAIELSEEEVTNERHEG